MAEQSTSARPARWAIDWKTTIPLAIAVVGFVFGGWQYFDKQVQTNREPFLREQLSRALETGDVVAVLATSTDIVAWETARDRFWVLYWGSLALVEDQAVDSAMAKLGRSVPEPGKPRPALPMLSLAQPSLELAHTLRDMVLRSWDVDMPALKTRGTNE